MSGEQINMIVTAGLTIAGSVLGYLSGRATTLLTSYTDLDQMYFELVKLRLEDPANATSDDYALMMWNFLEAIHDRTRGRGALWETWKPVFDSEAKKHLPWFSNNSDAYFKPSFIGAVGPLTKQGTALAQRPAA